jgi:NodT family efflux transporter outer membrane factor (OMF) lipoprotein
MAGLTASYEIDLWGKINAGHKALLLDIESRREDLAAAAITLSATIAKTWYQLAEAKQQADILTRQIETNEEVLEIISLKFQKGTVGAPDVLRQRQLVESTRGQLVQVNKAVTLRQHQLSVLLGRPPETRWANQKFHLIELGDLPRVVVPSELIRRRPDVVSAYKAVQKADQQVTVAVAEQYPSISLSASADTTSTRIEDLFDDWAASLAGSLVGPLFDAGLRKAEADRTRGVLSEAIHNYTQTVLNALKEVEDAISKEAFQWEYVRNIERQRKLARQSYESIRHKYISGQLDYLRVLDALISLQSLERSEVTAHRELIEHRIDLCRSIAGSWNMKRPDLARLSE